MTLMTGRPQEIALSKCPPGQDVFSLEATIYENVVVGLKAAARLPLGYFSLWELKYQQFFR